PLAKGRPQPRVQLDGQPADGLPPARPQLRVQGLSARGPRRGRHLRRAAPVRPRPGPCAGVPGRRDRGPPPPPQVRGVEVRPLPTCERFPGPDDRPLPDAVRPAPPACDWGGWRRGVPARWAWEWLPGGG